jgi:thioredoxin 1
MSIVNESNFDQEVLELSKTKPVLVDFFAEWCGGCKIMAPIIDELAEEGGDKFAVAKVNVEESPALVEKYEVLSLPTVVVFKDGQAVKTAPGTQSKESLLELFK